MNKTVQIEIEWVQVPLTQLSLDRDFVKICNKTGWHTMADLLNAGLRKIATHPKITDLWFEELINCLEKAGLLYRLKP